METLKEEIAKARSAQTALRFLRDTLKSLREAARADGHGGTEKSRKEAFAAGLEAALIDEDGGREHPMLNGSFLPPEHPAKGARAFGEGWSLGHVVRRVILHADGKPDPGPGIG